MAIPTKRKVQVTAGAVAVGVLALWLLTRGKKPPPVPKPILPVDRTKIDPFFNANSIVTYIHEKLKGANLFAYDDEIDAMILPLNEEETRVLINTWNAYAHDRGIDDTLTEWLATEWMGDYTKSISHILDYGLK